ncbi:pectinesterase family protein [Isoptericola sp. F-RaC21]|uniref:pectinesterase family protein n=1 Tax=Isoptericola sp. F-RaC21 TaxID=3141452 RepID=UPI00315C4963
MSATPRRRRTLVVSAVVALTLGAGTAAVADGLLGSPAPTPTADTPTTAAPSDSAPPSETRAGDAAADASAPAAASTRTAAARVAPDTYRLRNAGSHQCVDVPDASKANGTKLQQWGCTDDAAWQQFRVTADGDGTYRLVAAHSDQCVDLPGATGEAGTALQQWGCTPRQKQQQWKLEPTGGGYQVISAASGQCATVAAGGSGAAVVQKPCSDAASHRWDLELVASGGDGGGDGGGDTGNDGDEQCDPCTVAADGTGKYRTVQAAVDAVPADNGAEQVISIKPGTYRERVVVDKPNVSLVGGGASPSDVTIVEGVSAGEGGSHRDSATVLVQGPDFRADNLTITNDHDEAESPEGNQALALYLDADRAVIDDARILADQDTLMVGDPARAYVTDSYVEGTVDFIYGGGTAVFDRSTIHEKRETGGPITAASTPADQKYGFLFYRSTITGTGDGVTQLGRPWRPDASVVYRESDLSATVKAAEPWTNMSDNSWTNARYAEYKNTGAGATVNDNRPQLSDAEAAEHTPENYLAGSDGWNPVTAGGNDDGGSDAGSGDGEWSDVADGYAQGTTGGADGETVTASTYADLEKYVTAPEPYVVRVEGTLEADEMGKELKVTSNKTIIGAGDSGELVGGGFFLGEDTENVIIRNLTIRDTRMPQDDPDDKEFDYDAIQMDGATNVWIDHNRLVRMNDGLIDNRHNTTNVTVSWNEIAEDNKAFGIGWTEDLVTEITIHHNWIHDNNQRNPSIDNVAKAHLYNNLMENLGSYGNLARGGSKVVIENSYYDGVPRPFDRQDDAALTERGSIVVDSPGGQNTGGTTFDPKADYDYTLDPAADVPAIVKGGAGPQASITAG